MMTYQDYIKAVGDADNPDEAKKAAFILAAVEDYKNSDMYKRAYLAQQYYERKNQAILKRLTYLQRSGVIDASNLIFHRLCSGFFPKMCKQLSQYLLGNGVSLESTYKDKLGERFDKDLQTMGINTLVDGVNWGFWNVDKLKHYRATEFFVLPDEWSGIPMVGIHFWKPPGVTDKPLNIELFELRGITSYIAKDKTLRPMPGKTMVPYKTKIYSDQLSTQVIGTASYEVLPVFPLYANELQQSEFSDGLKSLIDAYDFIASDLADGITQTEGIYWAIKNYGGSDAAELVREIETFRATVNQDDADVKNFSVEIPHGAKQYALELLETNMYLDTMTLNLKQIQGGSLTNVAINVAKTDFDLKTDIFEWQVADFVQNILRLLGVPDTEIKFKRRTLTNDTETVINISTMMADGYLDIEGAVAYCPLIPDGDQEALLLRLQTEQLGFPPEDNIVADEPITEDPDEAGEGVG